MVDKITNISGYQFIVIDKVVSMHEEVQEICNQTHLKGTIFISPEGINLSLAGTEADTQFVLNELKLNCGFKNLIIHTTYSDSIPFKRLLVKIKEELVSTKSNRLNNCAIPYISSEELKIWLDNHKKITLLDLRNEFEYQLGTFDSAIQIHLKSFREIKDKVSNLESLPKNKPLVTFCTGGIRCEKGAAIVENYGFTNVYQLKGGILDYLSKFNDDHWRGDCFVFDDRISLDADLNPTYKKLCQCCQTILKKSENNFCTTCSGTR